MGASDTATAPASTMRRLLIVADNSLIVEAICIGFRRSGEFNLIGHVNGGRTSTRTMLEARPDVILLDDMDGGDLAPELISEISHAHEQVSLIALSVRMDGEHLTRLFDAGASAVISKATHPGALPTLVGETLNGHIVHKLAVSGAKVGLSASVASAKDSPLTGRELQILQLVAGGCTNCDIARRLWVTEQTVKFHLRNIYRKLGVANRTQASHLAHVNGLVDLQSALSLVQAPETSAAAS